MKKILLCLLTFALIFSLVGCSFFPEKEEETEPEKYPFHSTIQYHDYEHFLLDLKTSQTDTSSFLYLRHDRGSYTYIPQPLVSDIYFKGVAVHYYWFRYYFCYYDDPLSGFNVWVFRKEESINEVKEEINIKPGQKYVCDEGENSNSWFIMLDEYYIAQANLPIDKVTTYEELTEYISFEKFDSTQFYGYESGS